MKTNRRFTTMRQWALFTLLLMGCARTGFAAYGPDDNVGRGEQRLNTMVFKASHNSYERGGIKLHDQVDDYNVWCIELDLHRKNDGSFWVEHFCSSAHVAQELSTELNELNQSSTAKDKITCIFIQLAGEINTTCYKKWPTNNAEWLPALKSEINSALGASTIYPVDEFINQDLYAWPSYQELNRRGYKWFVVVSRGGISGIDVWNDDLVFAETTDPNPLSISNPYSNIGIANMCAGNDHGGRSDNIPGGGGDRFLLRGWPDSGSVIGAWCADHNNEYWNKAITRFNYIATNCIDDENTVDPGIHSPQPLFVNKDSTNTRQFGTKAYPKSDLISGLNQASPLVNVMIRTGTYDIANGTAVSKKVILKAENGSVIIK